MTLVQFNGLLQKEGFPESLLVCHDGASFTDLQSYSFEVRGLVLEGQIDVVIRGIRAIYLAGDDFHLPANEAYTVKSSAKGVKFLEARKAI